MCISAMKPTASSLGKIRFKASILALILLPAISFAQSDFYNIATVEIEKTYQASSPLAKYRYDSLSYNQAKNQTAYIFEKFTYKSDSFDVTGFSCRPRITNGNKTPVIIYNRGGTGNFGKITAEDFPDFYALAKNGFAVYASNYRFVDEQGSIDQLGGDDINDVVNLYEAIRKLDFVDQQNIFMLGVSRGGLMTYKSLTRFNVNAAAVIGGVADFENFVENRPIFLNGWTDLADPLNYKGLKNILPNFEQHKKQYLAERSATKWADQINTPLYILHSRQDKRVLVNGAIELVSKLNTFNKVYKMKIYDKKSHSLPYSKFDSFDEIIAWFKRHVR